MVIVPVVGVSNPAIMRSVVVLPQPLGPRNDTNSPQRDVQVEVHHRLSLAKDLGDVGKGQECHGFDFPCNEILRWWFSAKNVALPVRSE